MRPFLRIMYVYIRVFRCAGLRQDLSSQGIVRDRPCSTYCSSGSLVAIRTLWFSVEVCVDFFLAGLDSPICRQTQKLVGQRRSRLAVKILVMVRGHASLFAGLR